MMRGGHPNIMSDVTTVRVEDTHPRPNARPLDGRLVEKIAESIRLIGFSKADPIVVRKDGGMYWIIDGGHRTAAAKLAGLEEIPAIIEDLDDAGVLVVEGALNLQRPDTEAERWARAQQFMALGETASPRQIEVATGFDAETQAKARRVIKKLSDPVAAEDLTLEQAIAAHEYIEDDESFAEIMNAGDRWESVIWNLEQERKSAESMEAAKTAVEAAGCVLLEGNDRNDLTLTYIRQGGANIAAPKDATHASIQLYGSSAWITWYREGDEQVDTEAERKRQGADAKRAEFKANMDEAKGARYAFLRKLLQLAMPPVIAKVIGKELIERDWFELDLRGSADLLGVGEITERTISEMPVAALMASYVQWCDSVCVGDLLMGDVDDEYCAKSAIDWMSALTSSGYEPTIFELELLAAAGAAIANADEDGEAA